MLKDRKERSFQLKMHNKNTKGDDNKSPFLFITTIYNKTYIGL